MGVKSMNRLGELIQELCPNGVEYSSIGSIITRVREKGNNNPDIKQVYVVSNTQGMVRAEDYRDNAIHSEDTSNYTIVRENMVAYNPSRLNIGSIARLKYSEAGLVSPMYVVFSIDKTKMCYEYFDHMIKSSYVARKIDSLKEEGARFRFDYSRWDRIMIPIPPLPVQEEIVRILDNFTELTSELTSELTARKQQYNYYCNHLLALKDNLSVSYLPLEELAYSISSGKNKNKCDQGAYPVYGSTGIIAYTDKCVYTKNQILVARVGANAGFVHIATGEYDVSDNALIIDAKNSINFRYLYYQLRNIDLHRYAKGGGQPLVTAGQIKQIMIPIPATEEQERIVNILDRFNAICNDISSGLPAEIEVRQKQYEYYRDKLLSFEERK